MATQPPVQQQRPETEGAKVRLPENYEHGLIVRPGLPRIPGILGIGPDQCIASHPPHDPIKEHLHHQFHHLHIRYGFEFPQQTLAGIRDAISPVVVMAIRVEQRVDCNPIFVARGEGAEGICLHIDGEEVHWVHHDEAGAQAAELYKATGRELADGFYWSGFYMSDVEEREIRRFTREQLLRTIGLGLRADQHFQATWREPKDEPIEPYEVLICLTDTETSYYTFFRLPIVVPLGAF
jgi:hypothetical protein